MRTRWMLAMIAAVALFAAACGDSDGDDATPETTALAAADEAETTEAAPTPETTEAPAETSAADEADFGGADPDSDWCGLAADVQVQLDSVGADPFAFFSEEGLAQLTGVLDRAVQVAPPEIRSDVAASRDAFAGFGSVLEEYDFDLLSIPPAEIEAALDQEGLDAAGDRIQAYNEQVCGIESGTTAGDPGAGSDDPGTAPSLGSSEEAVDAFVNGLTATLPITEEQARCLAEELDLGALTADGSLDPNDPELLDQLFSVLGDCDISVTDLTG